MHKRISNSLQINHFFFVTTKTINTDKSNELKTHGLQITHRRVQMSHNSTRDAVTYRSFVRNCRVSLRSRPNTSHSRRTSLAFREQRASVRICRFQCTC